MGSVVEGARGAMDYRADALDGFLEPFSGEQISTYRIGIPVPDHHPHVLPSLSQPVDHPAPEPVPPVTRIWCVLNANLLLSKPRADSQCRNTNPDSQERPGRVGPAVANPDGMVAGIPSNHSPPFSAGSSHFPRPQRREHQRGYDGPRSLPEHPCPRQDHEFDVTS